MEGKEQVHLQSCFILGLHVLTRDALAAGLAACSTYANMFPPDKSFSWARHDITHLVTYCDVVHIVESLSYSYGIFRFESLSDLLTLFKNIYVTIARSYNILRG